MPSLPSHLKMPSRAVKARAIFLNSLNFYRVHLMTFALVSMEVILAYKSGETDTRSR